MSLTCRCESKWRDGRREALLFVIEEESDPRRFSIYRLAHYCLDLGELLETDRVVPVVIFLRGQASRRELVFGGERHAYLRFGFLACELATIAYERDRESDNIVARINLPSMRSAPERRLDVYAAAMRGVVSREEDPEKQLKYFGDRHLGHLFSCIKPRVATSVGRSLDRGGWWSYKPA